MPSNLTYLRCPLRRFPRAIFPIFPIDPAIAFEWFDRSGSEGRSFFVLVYIFFFFFLKPFLPLAKPHPKMRSWVNGVNRGNGPEK